MCDVFWCRCAYVLVCEVDENCMQAEAVLVVISRMVTDHVTSHEQENAEVRHFCTDVDSI